MWQEIVAARQYTCLFSRRIIAQTHLLRRWQPAITAGRRHFLSHGALSPFCRLAGFQGRSVEPLSSPPRSSATAGLVSITSLTRRLCTLIGPWCSLTHVIYLANQNSCGELHLQTRRDPANQLRDSVVTSRWNKIFFANFIAFII